MSYYCEKCGKFVSDENYFGSGRYCSRSCANSGKGLNKEQNLKRSESVKRHHKNAYLLSPKFCVDCGKQIDYERRSSKYCLNCSITRRHNARIKGGVNGGKISALSQQRRSKNEIYFCELCESYFSNVKHNEPIFNGWDADIIIEDIKYAILWNGNWHYKQISKKQSLEQVQIRDKIKLDQINSCGYTPYIIKDPGKYNPKFVDEQFNLFIEKLNN